MLPKCNKHLSCLVWVNISVILVFHSASQAGRFTNVCAVPRVDDKLGVPSAGITWWTLMIPESFAKKR